MKIASWNINSVRLRLPLVKQFLEHHPVDILCLQETKVQDAHFPHDDIKALGFKHIMFRGQKSYNGVAILSKIPLDQTCHTDFGGMGDTRHQCVNLPDGTELHNFYVPAGGDIPDPELNTKFAHKLRFLNEMTEWSKLRDSSRPAIIMGDFNIAPHENDVWSSKQLRNTVSHTPVEREGLIAFMKSGDWHDTHRHHGGDGKLYSWWSYRAHDWLASNRGRRLDHLWVSPQLRDRVRTAHIFQETRGWLQPSDHVPIIAEFATS